MWRSMEDGPLKVCVQRIRRSARALGRRSMSQPTLDTCRYVVVRSRSWTLRFFWPQGCSLLITVVPEATVIPVYPVTSLLEINLHSGADREEDLEEEEAGYEEEREAMGAYYSVINMSID